MRTTGCWWPRSKRLDQGRFQAPGQLFLPFREFPWDRFSLPVSRITPTGCSLRVNTQCPGPVVPRAPWALKMLPPCSLSFLRAVVGRPEPFGRKGAEMGLESLGLLSAAVLVPDVTAGAA